MGGAGLNRCFAAPGSVSEMVIPIF